MNNDLIQEYEALGVNDRLAILGEISALRGKAASGFIPTIEEMQKASESSGHPELFLTCYSAELMGKDWYTKWGDRTRDTRN